MNDDSGVWLVFIAVALLGVWYWNKWPSDYEAQVKRLENFAENQIGGGPDFWLVKRNAYGVFEKTALFFGYWNDEDACNEFATFYTNNYPSDQYLCVIARGQ